MTTLLFLFRALCQQHIIINGCIIRRNCMVKAVSATSRNPLDYVLEFSPHLKSVLSMLSSHYHL